MLVSLFFFFFNDTATTEIYTLSLHDALPIFPRDTPKLRSRCVHVLGDILKVKDGSNTEKPTVRGEGPLGGQRRSEEHTSELQSQSNLVCRLLLEKKKNKNQTFIYTRACCLRT